MNHRHRLDQLHLLIDRLEQLPPSANRDWMMVEVRARAADVETGVEPGPVRPRNRDATIPPSEATPAYARPARPIERPADVAPRAVPVEAPAPTPLPLPSAAPRVREDRVDLLGSDGVLCLGDSPGEAPVDTGHMVSPPWARGLRG
jgi:hypothetical protein